MKKSLIALAVAGAFAAPAFAATGNVDVYGKLRVSLDYVDLNGGLESSWQLNDQTSRIGFKGSEDLGGGLKAIWQIEQALSSQGKLFGYDEFAAGGEFSNIGGGTLAGRNTFVGLSGDFGTVLAGRHDTPYKLVGSADIFADTSADSQNGNQLGGIIGYDLDWNGIGGFDIRATNAIAYVSPSFSGVTVIGAVVPGESYDSGSKANGIADAYSLGVLYANGPLSLGLGYEMHTKDIVYDITTGIYGSGNGISENESAWKLNAGYAIGDLKLGATFESQDGVLGMKSTNYLVSAAYGMGPITLAAQYGKRDPNSKANNILGDSDLTRYTLGAVYGFSKRTSAYFAYDHDKYEKGAFDGLKANIYTIGLNHDF
ncbi:porin [Parasulfuritortus cantonensis]|uniref:Porin n=1 Tax=Parasulfuritortus cantonensis TaxID=2528202 RepID=A0A4R1BIN0_9PROT|nr:porin [Parasulfuritortus cantonensis]TCJ17114.1 porin [Parasulfuritortus cantonensis]